MNMHHKLYSIASLLDQSMEGAHRFVQEVNLALPNRVSYGKICHAISKLPVRERTAKGVAAYLLKTERRNGRPLVKRISRSQTQETKHPISTPTTEPVEISTKVVGVTFDGRQDVVAKLFIHEEIVLRREPTNPYDHNAIRVERLSGEQIGYIDRCMAASLAPALDAFGEVVHGTVSMLTGGSGNGYSLGVDNRFTVPSSREYGRKLKV